MDFLELILVEDDHWLIERMIAFIVFVARNPIVFLTIILIFVNIPLVVVSLDFAYRSRLILDLKLASDYTEEKGNKLVHFASALFSKPKRNWQSSI